MARDRKVLDEEVEYLGPVAIAMFVDLGWIRLWPMSWSRRGLTGLLNGYGRWEGTRQILPISASDRADGVAHWDRRRTRLPVGTNIPIRQEAA
ncbi:hypothetical protein ACVWW6_006000 [Bradyrhizobium sp. USDA 3311]